MGNPVAVYANDVDCATLLKHTPVAVADGIVGKALTVIVPVAFTLPHPPVKGMI